MENNLSKISLLSAFYEEKKSFFDVYEPFILQVCQTKEITKLSEVEESLNGIFGFILPVNVIKTILSENEGNHFSLKKTIRSDWDIVLTENGKKSAEALYREEDAVKADIDFLEQDVILYIKKKYQLDISQEETHKCIKSFLENNISKYSERKHFSIQTECEKFDNYFVSYLNNVARIDKRKDAIIENLWKGSILLSQMEDNKDKKVAPALTESLDIYIDTNIVFSLLGLHSDIVNQSVFELFELIKKSEKIHTYVLDTTIDELDRMLNNYETAKNNFYEIEVDSVFYHLKKRGFDSSEILNLKDSVLEQLEKKGVLYRETDYLETASLKYYSYVFPALFAKRKERNAKFPKNVQKREEIIERAAHHDAFVIGYSLLKKNKRTYNFADVKSLFLTSSNTLYYDYLKVYNTIENYPVVIRDITLTNILYLLNPQKATGPNLEQILSAHTNLLFVNSSLWSKYLSSIKKLLEKDTIDIREYSLLVSNNKAVKDYICELDDKEVDSGEVSDILRTIENEYKFKDNQVTIATQTINDKDSTISLLQESLAKQKQEKEDLLKKLVDQEELVQKNRYFSDMEINIKPIISRRTRAKYIFTVIYSVFIFGSVALFVLNDNNISRITSVVFFFAPWICRFIKHDRIIQTFHMMLSKKARKDYYDEQHSIESNKYQNEKPFELKKEN